MMGAISTHAGSLCVFSGRKNSERFTLIIHTYHCGHQRHQQIGTLAWEGFLTPTGSLEMRSRGWALSVRNASENE
jgi:hypothetical protein